MLDTLFPKTKKLLLVSSFMFATSIAGGVTLWYLVSTEQKLFREYSAQATSASLHEHMLTRITALLRSSKEDRALVADSFITERETVTFLEELEARADKMELTFEILSVTAEGAVQSGEKKEEIGNAQIGIQFSATGPWDQVIHFLSITELLPYLVTVSSVRLDEAVPLGTWRLTTIIHIAKRL
jgi:hypothetical protein